MAGAGFEPPADSSGNPALEQSQPPDTGLPDLAGIAVTCREAPGIEGMGRSSKRAQDRPGGNTVNVGRWMPFFGNSEGCAGGDKSQSINRPEGHGKGKRRGQKTADYETQQSEARLSTAWVNARDAGMSKADFAKDKGLSLKEFDKLFDRVAARNRRCDK